LGIWEKDFGRKVRQFGWGSESLLDCHSAPQTTTMENIGSRDFSYFWWWL